MGNVKEMEEIFYIYDMILPLSGESGYDSCQGEVFIPTHWEATHTRNLLVGSHISILLNEINHSYISHVNIYKNLDAINISSLNWNYLALVALGGIRTV